MPDTIRTALARKPAVAAGIRLFEAWLETQMEYRGLPGASVGVVYDQELVWARGFGYADRARKRRAAPGTLYRIASITKTFTATAVMLLRDEGRLRLDDPVEAHLPWFRPRRPEDAEPITVRHLLTHTGGLPRESPFPYWTNGEFPTREQLMEALPGQEVICPPDERCRYSNLGLTLAGEVVAAVSGQPYETFLRERVLEPLGMSSTSLGVPDPLRDRLAVGYGRRMPDGSRALRPFTEARAIDPAAGLASSVEDLARFASLQLRTGPAGGAQILKGATLREMHRPHWVHPDWTGGWGLGFAVLHTKERDLVRHGGWVPGYQSEFAVSVKEKAAAILLTNADDGAPYSGGPLSLTDKVFKWIVPPLVKAATPETKPPRVPQKYKFYEGRYRSPWGDTQVMVLNGKLTAIAPTELDPTGTQVTLIPTGEHTFRTERATPSTEDLDRVEFIMGKNGRVTRLKWGENYSEPVPRNE